MFKKFSIPFFALFCMSSSALAGPYDLSPQLTLMNLTPAIQASANQGKGVIFADIDTGISKAWVGFNYKYNTALAKGTNNINTALSAQCLKGACPVLNREISYAEGGNSGKYKFPEDLEGHGVFTASEIVGGVQGAGLVSVAPAGTMIAVQVLDAKGSGTFPDIANGIKYAVNSGARILNLSLGPSGLATPAQQAAAYQGLATAVNYAASKGAVLVFAGGNDAIDFSGGANIKGFTNQALSHMLIAGSTDEFQNLSFFSNTPGAAGFTSTTGTFVSYQSMWVMTQGENIWGASNYHDVNGYSYITQKSGTSMSAPQVTGVAGLLAAKWPILLKNGTIPQIITSTAADLGAAGVDAVYGNGFVDVTAAFTAVGPFSVPVSGGSGPVLIPLAGGFSAGGALGNLANVSKVLSNASYYDKYGRDFPVNLGSAITTKSSSQNVSAATLRVTGSGGAASRSFTQQENGSWFALAGSPGAIQTKQEDSTTSPGLTQDPTRRSHNVWSAGFQQENGTYVGVGQGPDAALSFNDARWGGKTAYFNSEDSMGGTLLSLTDRASYSTVGFDEGKNGHISVGVMSTGDEDYTSYGGQEAAAYGAVVGYTIKPSDNMSLSWTSSYIDESNMLLGSPGSGYLSLGEASTVSFGMGASVNLGEGYNLGFDTIVATTSPTNNQASLISGTSRLYSAGASVVLNKANLTGHNDTMGVSVKKPLRVYGGSANVGLPSAADSEGTPVIQNVKTSLVPSGNETDVGIDYLRPLSDKSTLSFGMTYRDDADNVAGAKDSAAMTYYKRRF